MRVLVTGGQGFIGRYVCERLARGGHEVVVLDRFAQSSCEYERIIGDVRDRNLISEAVGNVDGVIHLAAVLGTQETIDNPVPVMETNLIGSGHILEACHRNDIPMTYIAVGNHWMNNTYSISKSTVERFIKMFNKELGTRFNMVRAVNAYGPRQSAAKPYGSSKVRKITPSFVCRALSGDPIEIYGDGHQISDMVFVTDVAEALVRSLESAAIGDVYPEPLEVGPAKHHTVNEVAELIIDLSKSTSGIVHLPMRPGEIPNAEVVADTRTMLYAGMTPDKMVPLAQGMMETIAYFRGYLGR